MTAAGIDPHAAFLSENGLQNRNYENKIREAGFEPISDITDLSQEHFGVQEITTILRVIS